MQSVVPVGVKRETQWIEVAITSDWGGVGALVTNATDSISVTLRNIGDFAFEYRINAGEWALLEFHGSILLNVSLASTGIRLRKSEFGGDALARLEIDSLTNEFSADGSPLTLGSDGGATTTTIAAVDYLDQNFGDFSSGVVDTTTNPYNNTATQGQSTLCGYPNTPADSGIWVLGSMTDPAAVPVTRRADALAGTTFQKGQVIRVGSSIPPSKFARCQPYDASYYNWQDTGVLGTHVLEFAPGNDSGYLATASGGNATASGDFSTASGQGSIASGIESVASGASSTASGPGSIATGNAATASGGASIASGANATASGISSTASGYASQASGSGSIASGNSSTASGENSIASGQNSVASGDCSIASGDHATASGVCSIASGASGNDPTVASGANSIASGQGSTASGANAIASGLNSVASGQGAVASGSASIASGQASTASGEWSHARVLGCEAHASGAFALAGDAQAGRYVLMHDTTGAGSATLLAAASAALVLPDNASFAFSGRVIAREPATGDTKSWKFEGAIKRGPGVGTTALVGAVTPSEVAADTGASAWTIAVSADTGLGALAVIATGEADKTIQWVCAVSTVETAG
jgi:hypothetical protein